MVRLSSSHLQIFQAQKESLAPRLVACMRRRILSFSHFLSVQSTDLAQPAS